MVSGLGSGLFLFDQYGGPVNPLDNNADRVGAQGVAPAANFDPVNVRFDLDRIVLPDGTSTGSNTHPMLDKTTPRRDGAGNPDLSGPMGASLIQRLSDPVSGIVLDSWLDANGATGGDASTYVP